MRVFATKTLCPGVYALFAKPITFAVSIELADAFETNCLSIPVPLQERIFVNVAEA